MLLCCAVGNMEKKKGAEVGGRKVNKKTKKKGLTRKEISAFTKNLLPKAYVAGPPVSMEMLKVKTQQNIIADGMRFASRDLAQLHIAMANEKEGKQYNFKRLPGRHAVKNQINMISRCALDEQCEYKVDVRLRFCSTDDPDGEDEDAPTDSFYWGVCEVRSCVIVRDAPIVFVRDGRRRPNRVVCAPCDIMDTACVRAAH